MKKRLSFLLGILCPLILTAQKITVSGTVTDINSSETIISASVYEESTLSGSVTNNYGYYAIRVPKGKIKLICSCVGYNPFVLELNLKSDTTINIQVAQNVQELQEVVVTDKSPQRTVQSTQMGQIELRMPDLKTAPVLLGEVDIIKTLQLMPGVQGGTEGSAGFFVRGGAPDQNLILLDGVPVYNVNHLFGFFSVFNADAVKNVSLIKGGFPARYGGRLSSVVDIRMKEGNMKEFHGEASVGLISSKLTLEGPIVKDKTSFLIAGRRTYYDLIIYPAQLYANKHFMDEGSRVRFGAYFYDLNLKINQIISEKDRFFLSAYMGKDRFYLKSKEEDTDLQSEYKYKSDAGLWWGNITTATRWNHKFGNRLFSNLTGTFSDFTFETFMGGEEYSREDTNIFSANYDMNYYSRIRDYALIYDFDFPINENHYLRFGAGTTIHSFSPGVGVFREDSNIENWEFDTAVGIKNIPAYESNTYIEDEINVTPWFKANVGFHFSVFNTEGKTYISPEPRISTRFLLNPNLSLKASFVTTKQYINLLTNSSIGLPTDLWIPCTPSLKPQKAWQTALGFAYNLNNQFEFTVEGYYKEMKNLVEFKEGYGFFSMGFNDLEQLTTQGKGVSYGSEFMVQKSTGKFRGWISYTLSWSSRRFNEISYGREFPFTYDRRHNIAIVTNYDITPRINIGAAWTFYTGSAFTLPDEKALSPYWMDNEIFTAISNNYNFYENPSNGYFETRNNYRMPYYHRLNVGLNFKKQLKRFERTWGIGAYNAYNRKNPFMLYQTNEWDESSQSSKTVIKQITVLPIVPYIRYSLKF